MRVLTWNLYHGRAVPPARRALLAEFGAALAGWPWDVALLQEVPPWWPPALAAACGAEAWDRALTSRNAGLPVRRWIAERAPDLIKSGGGGCNAILVRGERIAARRALVLRRRPERRVAQGVELDGGAWVVNLHATVHDDAAAREDVAAARAAALGWAAGAPVVLGGDLNVFDPDVPGFVRAASHRVDFVWARGYDVEAPGVALEHGALSDHEPVAVELR